METPLHFNVQPLTDAIMAFSDSSHPSAETIKSRERIIKKLEDIINLTIRKRCQLLLFGSSQSGLSTNNSDIDLCLLVGGMNVDDVVDNSNINHNKILRMLANAFHKNGIQAMPVLLTRVPIVKCFVDFYQVDICLNRPQGVRNSRLISKYVSLDTRVRILCLAVKSFYETIVFLGSNAKGFTSYCASLMVLFFLQHKKVIPNLQGYSLDPVALPKDETSVGQLFLDFLLFYATMDFERVVINIKNGGDLVARKEDTAVAVMIQDPLESDVNCARLVTLERITLFKQSCLDRRRVIIKKLGRYNETTPLKLREFIEVG